MLIAILIFSILCSALSLLALLRKPNNSIPAEQRQEITREITTSLQNVYIQAQQAASKDIILALQQAYSQAQQTMLKELAEHREHILKSQNEMKETTTKSFTSFNLEMRKLFETFSESSHKNLQNYQQQVLEKTQKSFDALNQTVEKKLEAISGKVDERLNEGFKKTNETFLKITERLVKIDEAQKKIEALSVNVNSLQNVLTDKKTRGIFGEVQLNQILHNVFGDKNDKLFDLQHGIGTHIADAVVFLPEPHGMLAIDSKFPLESYSKMYDQSLSTPEQDAARRMFKQNVKKHINDIADKYIVQGVTAEVAIMFLPAEAIFAEVNAYHPDLVEFAIGKGIWICSPTTLIGVLTTIQAVVRDIETGKQAKIIQEELSKLSKEFERYSKRWDDLSRHIKTVNGDVDKIHITTQKITKNFDRIRNVEIELDDAELLE